MRDLAHGGLQEEVCAGDFVRDILKRGITKDDACAHCVRHSAEEIPQRTSSDDCALYRPLPDGPTAGERVLTLIHEIDAVPRKQRPLDERLDDLLELARMPRGGAAADAPTPRPTASSLVTHGILAAGAGAGAARGPTAGGTAGAGVGS